MSYRQPEDKRKRRKLILVQSAFFVGAMGIASGIFRSHAFGHPTPIAGLPLAAGIFGAGVEFWIGLKTAVFRFFVIAAISAAAGVALAMSGFTEMAAFGAYWGIMGAVKCSSGAFSLFLYLRRHPASGADPT